MRSLPLRKISRGENTYILPFRMRLTFSSSSASRSFWRGGLISNRQVKGSSGAPTDGLPIDVLVTGVYEHGWLSRTQHEQAGFSPGHRVFFLLSSLVSGSSW